MAFSSDPMTKTWTSGANVRILETEVRTNSIIYFIDKCMRQKCCINDVYELLPLLLQVQ
jgi:hypothetical protein